ncbi:hypothetical protein C8R46DRAFT_1192331 [Mycena filopes]|nr:hypothetical protein C8R46DRAFT_1192331 [Mycena filopes]
MAGELDRTSWDLTTNDKKEAGVREGSPPPRNKPKDFWGISDPERSNQHNIDRGARRPSETRSIELGARNHRPVSCSWAQHTRRRLTVKTPAQRAENRTRARGAELDTPRKATGRDVSASHTSKRVPRSTSESLKRSPLSSRSEETGAKFDWRCAVPARRARSRWGGLLQRRKHPASLGASAWPEAPGEPEGVIRTESSSRKLGDNPVSAAQRTGFESFEVLTWWYGSKFASVTRRNFLEGADEMCSKTTDVLRN